MRNRQRKGQLQSGETILIVFVVIILVVMGFVFFAKQQTRSISNDIVEERSRGLEAMVITLSNMPELLCSQNGTIDASCYDYIKAEKFADLINDTADPSAFLTYSDLLGTSTIILRIVYSEDTGYINSTILLYNNTPEDFVQKLSAKIPMGVFFPVENSMGFGVAYIDIYT